MLFKKIILCLFVGFSVSFSSSTLLPGQQHGTYSPQAQVTANPQAQVNPQAKHQPNPISKFFIIALNLAVKLPIQILSSTSYYISLFAGLMSASLENLGNLIPKPEV